MLHLFTVAVDEIYGLRQRCDAPGEHVEQIEGLNGAEVGEHGVDPDHAENAGTHDDDEGGPQALANAAGSGDGGIHKGGYAVGKTHDGKTEKSRLDHGVVGGKQGQEGPAEYHEKSPQDGACRKGIGEADEIAFQDALPLTRSVVLTHEAGAGGVEGGHDVVHETVGVGGGGVNAVNRMMASGVKGVEFIAVNTDKQSLKKSTAPTRLVIGEKITNGFGAGSNPEIGKRAAEEAVNELKQLFKGADMIFVTAGMGGGTGTGALPVVAKVAHELDILTVGVVTTPFAFEGKRRMDLARAGIEEVKEFVDTLVVIPNERLKMVTDTRITLANAFSEADDVLRRGVQSISDLINIPGFINIDFADVTSVISNSGVAYMGMGSAKGKDKAVTAANMAISSPLIETPIKGAKGVLLSVLASPDVGLEDVDTAATMIADECNPNASVIWGVAFDPNLEDEMKITIIAAGFDKDEEENTAEAEQQTATAESNIEDIFSKLM